jgi:16S rRNA processing protein RimM
VADNPDTVPVGYVRRAHGVVGAVIVRSLTDAPELRYVKGALLTTDEDPPRVLTVTSVRSHKDGFLIGFEGVASRNEAEAMRGVSFTIPRSERRQLKEDEYWEEDLIGLAVVDVAGQSLGAIVSIVTGAAQDRLAVETESGDRVEVPFVDPIVVDVSIAEGRVVVDPPEGLF